MDLDVAMQAVADQLNTAGIRATIDGTDAHPPCVLVRPPTLTGRFNKGTWDAQFEAWAMVPANNQAAALKQMGDLLTDVQTALIGRVVTAAPDDANLTDGGTVPMYRCTWIDRLPA